MPADAGGHAPPFFLLVLSSCFIAHFLITGQMLDTVAVRFACRLKRPRPANRGGRERAGLKVWTDSTGLYLCRAEFCLPKILFGNNGRLLETQSDIDRGIAAVVEALRNIAEVASLETWKATRLDLVWNYNLPAAPIILAHASLQHPLFRRLPSYHGGGLGLTWMNAQSRLAIKFYDKGAQMKVPDSKLRVEILIRGRELRKRVEGDEWRQFSFLRLLYRSILIRMPPVAKPVLVRNWQEAVAQQPMRTRLNILACLSHLPRQTFRRYKRRIEAAAANLKEEFSWKPLLPVDEPWTPVHLDKACLFSGRDGEALSTTNR